MTGRDEFEAVVRRIAGRRLHPLEIERILSAADAYRRTARYRDNVKPCGSHAAYVRHLRRKEPPCAKCLAGEAARAADDRAALRAVTAA